MGMHERMDALADLMVAGGLSMEESAEAKLHTADCAACGALVRDAQDFASWAKGLIRRDAPPLDLEDRLIERFRSNGRRAKKRFVAGGRVLKVTASIAAAAVLIFLGSLVHLDRPAAGIDQSLAIDGTEARREIEGSLGRHVHFSLDQDARVHPVAPEEGPVAKLKSLPSAEADFRANDRDWNHVNDFWTGDVKGLYTMTGSLTASSQKFDQYFGWEGDGADKGGEGDRLARAEVETVKKSLEDRQSNQASKWKYQRKLNDEKTGKSADLPDADATSTLVLTTSPRSLPSLAQGGGGPLTGATLPVVANPEVLPAQDNRKVIRNADVSLEVESYDATYAKLGELAAAEKGFISSANTQKMANGKIQATVVVRVPPDHFEAFVARFKELGTVRHQSIGSEDVTKAYIDLESRLAGKQTLAARLTKLLAEGKGAVKELMDVEVQLGATNEAIEQIKGEIKYYDNRIGLSTVSLQIAEKDLGQPFEYVQTLSAQLALTVREPDDAYAKAQKEIAEAGGQVVDSHMNRQNDGSSTGSIRARIDADKFPGLRDALKKLGVPTNDTVSQQKTAHGGQEGTPKADAPLRKEQAVLDLSVASPPVFVTRRLQLVLEARDVEGIYAASRKSVEGMGGKIVDGSLTGRGDRMVAVLKIQADADQFGPMMESLKTRGKVKNATVNSVLPTAAADGSAALLRERAEIEFTLVSPPQLIAEENGLGKSIRDTLVNSWAGLLWSIEKLFVGVSLAGPWLVILGAGIFGWKKLRRKKAVGNP